MLEKTNGDANVDLNGHVIAQLCDLVGIKVASETEGYQIHYGGKSITVAIWPKKAVSIERFVSEERIRFNNLPHHNGCI